MSESLHRSEAPGEPTMYPMRGDADRVASIEAYSLRAAILAACLQLGAATEEYAASSAALAEATTALHEARMQLQFTEDRETSRCLPALTGKNAEERKAQLAEMLWDIEEVDDARTRRDGCLAVQVADEHRFRVADQAQKSLRARLAALSALVGAS